MENFDITFTNFPHLLKLRKSLYIIPYQFDIWTILPRYEGDCLVYRPEWYQNMYNSNYSSLNSLLKKGYQYDIDR